MKIKNIKNQVDKRSYLEEIRQLKSTSLEQPLPSSTQATSITPGKIEPE